jgi:hypothetical protein
LNFKTRSVNPEVAKSFVYLDFYPVGYPIGVPYIYIYINININIYINIYTHISLSLYLRPFIVDSRGV